MADDDDSADGGVSVPTEPEPDILEYDSADSIQEVEEVGGQPDSAVRPVLAAGLIAVLAVGGVAGWLGFSAYQTQQTQHDREVLLQVARQTALNLTTIDHSQAEADVQRVLDSATGAFHDDFKSRSTEFVEVVKKAQSKSEGSIVESGLESKSGDEAQVLVAVNVKSVNVAATEAEPRGWRMRLTVQKTADAAKVSNVEFVP